MSRERKQCVKCRIEKGRCIYGCPFTEIYIEDAVGSDKEGVTIWTKEEYDKFAEERRKENYGVD